MITGKITTDILIGTLIFAEIFCLCSAAFIIFRRQGNSFAESAAYAIITIFMLLSFVHQISFITGYSIVCNGVEAFFFMGSILLIFKHRSEMFNLVDIFKTFGTANPIAFSFLGISLVYMAIHGLLPVPNEFQNELYTIALYEKDGFSSLAADSEFPGFLPVNHLILFNTFLQFGSNVGAAIFSFLAYLSIGFSTYALARRYSWQTTSFTTAILVMSMPRLVVQAIYPNTQIICVAVTLFCILALYRCVELPNLTDLIFLILGLFFSISENISSMIFGPILLALSCLILFRRHGALPWKSILVKNPYALAVIVPAALFSQSWLFLSNHFNKSAWPGIFSTISFNPDGIQGALANFIRYLFEGLNFAAPVELFFKDFFYRDFFYGDFFYGELFFDKIFKWSMAENLQSLYDVSVIPFLGKSGAIQVFHLTWHPIGMFSFGPVGFFLVIPALVYAMVKGPRRLKSIAISFFVYFYLISLILAWAPGNERFLEIFYVCSGFSISFFFPPWRFSKTKQKIFQTAGCLLLLLTLLAAS